MSDGRQPASERQLDRIVVYWTLFNEGGRFIACELCRTGIGLEVRCIRDGADVVRTGPVPTAADGATVAAQWKTSWLAKGHFVERPIPDVSNVKPIRGRSRSTSGSDYRNSRVEK